MKPPRPRFPDQESIDYLGAENAKRVMQELGVYENAYKSSRDNGATAAVVVETHPTHWCICVIDVGQGVFDVLARRKGDYKKEEMYEIVRAFFKGARMLETYSVRPPVTDGPLTFKDQEEVINDPLEAKAVLLRLGRLAHLERDSIKTGGTVMVLHRIHPTHWCICVADTVSFEQPFYAVHTWRKSHFTLSQMEEALEKVADSMAPIEEDPSADSN